MDNISFHEAGHPDVLCYLKGGLAAGPALCASRSIRTEAVEAELALPLDRLGVGPDDAASRSRTC